MYEDKTLKCKDCGADFVFTADDGAKREMFTAVCAGCGGEAKVPFQPRDDRPVYCSECFAKRNEH